MDSSHRTGDAAVTALPVRPRGLGVPFFLLLLYPVFDYGRPPNPMGIPMVISILLALAWIASPAKKINAHIVCFLLLLAGLTIGSVGAVNHALRILGGVVDRDHSALHLQPR